MFKKISTLLIALFAVLGLINLTHATYVRYIGLFTDALGNVGIGTTTPNKLLHLYKTDSNSEIDLQTQAGIHNHFGIYSATSTSQTNNSHRIWSANGSGGGTDALTILANGNIGVGPSTPAAKLGAGGVLNMNNHETTSLGAPVSITDATKKDMIVLHIREVRS